MLLKLVGFDTALAYGASVCPDLHGATQPTGLWPDNDLTFFETRKYLHHVSGLQTNLDIQPLGPAVTIDDDKCTPARGTNRIRWQPKRTFLVRELHNYSHLIAALVGTGGGG